MEYGDGRSRHRRESRPPWAIPLTLLILVLALALPATWVLVWNNHDALSAAKTSAPFVTYADDRYPSATPSPSDPANPSPTDEPSRTPSARPSPTDTPSRTPTPSARQTVVPTEGPSPTRTRPTGGPAEAPTTKPADTPPTSRPTVRPTSTTGPADDGSMTADEQELFAMINAKRADAGCAPLRPDSRLTASAREHAQDMAQNDYLGTSSQNGDNPEDRMRAHGVSASRYGENVSDASDAATAANSWGTNCSLTAAGVGKATATVKSCAMLVICSTRTETRWVADYTG